MREMKDSGIYYINDIPRNYSVIRTRFICDISTGNKDTINRKDDGEFPFYVRSKTIERIDSYSFEGEAVLTSGDGDVGEIFHYIDGKFDFHQRVYMFSNFRFIVGKLFFYYCISNFPYELGKYSAKTTVESLRLPWIKNFPVVVPPIGSQGVIIDYLDQKISLIDNIIEKTKQSIEEYKKLKQSIITEAVTKGLNPDVKMKDSGIEWIGMIPEHWEVTLLKRVSKYQEGPGILGSDFVESGIPLIRISGMKGNKVTLDGCNYLNPTKVKDKWEHFKLDIGDIVISASASTGIVAIVDKETAGSIPYTGLIRFKVNPDITNDFLKYFFDSNTFLTQIDLQKTGSTIHHYGPTHLAKVIFMVPPKEEQVRIVNYLDSKFEHIDNLIQQKDDLIKEYESYKKSLIYEVVTGKKEIA